MTVTARESEAHGRTRLLDLPDPERHILVVGGGADAAWRVMALSNSRYRVRVVAPSISDEMFDLLLEHRIQWEKRAPRESDLDGGWLVHAHTGDADTDARICGWVDQRRRRNALRADTAQRTDTTRQADVAQPV